MAAAAAAVIGTATATATATVRIVGVLYSRTMYPPPVAGRTATGSRTAAIVLAHLVGAAAVGALEAVRLGSLALVFTLVPLFAATGLLIAAVAILGARVADLALSRISRSATRTPLPSSPRVAVALAAPSLALTIPVAATLFDGAYAHTLPGAHVLPIVLPVVAWAAIAAVIALGQQLARTRRLALAVAATLAVATLAVELANRHVVRLGYPTLHAGATLAILALAGIALRVAFPGTLPARRVAAIVALTCGAALATLVAGLRAPADRLTLATAADDGRHLVRLWRTAIDLDRDGYSAVLGGGDCDDLDASRHPGAFDVPGDGIDQDCDGTDATRTPATPPPPPTRALDLASWRATPPIRDLLARTAGMNVVVISVDALRFDLLAPGAPGREDFPRLTALFDQSIWFTRAIAPAAGTDVSLSTFLTGRLDPYQAIETTLPEAMRASGRRTTAAIPGEVLRYVGDTLIGRGLDKLATVFTDWAVADVGDHVSASTTTYEALKALDGRGSSPAGSAADRGRGSIDTAAGKPCFVWAHYFDVHEHHQIDVPPELLLAVRDMGGSVQQRRYRALLLAIDREVGHLLDELAARHLDDHTIVVFASDHGEGLGDDPRLPDTHGQVAYAALTRIPLAVRIPGVPGARRTDAASLVDLAPTLLDLIGTPTAIAPLDGVDLVPALLDAPLALRTPNRAIVIHEEVQWAVVEWPFQLLVRPADDTVELYDLERDPDEHDDLAARRPEVVTRLRARYAEVPVVKVDRTSAGRAWREQQAQPPQHHAPS